MTSRAPGASAPVSMASLIWPYATSERLSPLMGRKAVDANPSRTLNGP